MISRWIQVLAVVFVCGAVAADDWLDADSYGDVRVVVADSASASEQEAAREFQRYWKESTGHDAPVGNSPAASGVHVWIGRDGIPQRWLEKIDLAKLGTDGLCLRSVDEGNLLIVGGRERGTLYGVYEFFERYMGVRWLTPTVTHIPEEPPRVLPKIDYVFVPPFIFRDTSYTVRRPNKPYFEQVHKHSRYPGIGLGVHSFYRLLPPDEFFAEHPEYYSEIQGERVALLGVNAYDAADMMRNPGGQRGQLCLSNPEVVEALAASLKQIMREEPDKKMFNVAQMDWANNCQCESCRAIDEREGSPSGSILTAINTLADMVAEEFPDRLVGTLAYQYSRKPPKHIKPRDNVQITLCSIECDFSVPLDDPRSSINRAFVEDLKGWAAITKNFFVWDYTPNFENYLTPHPNFHVLGPNARLFAENNVTMVYEQGCAEPPGEFQELRGYMVEKVMWNPWVDADAVKNEFIELYYREAAPFIHEYINLLTARVLDPDVVMDCFDPGVWLDYDLVVQAEEIFARAFQAVESPVTRERLDFAYLPLQYAALKCAPKVALEGNILKLERPPSITLGEFIENCKNAPDTVVLPLYDIMSKTSSQLGDRTPARNQTVAIEVLENDHALLWIAPELQGAVLRWRNKDFGIELLRGYKYLDSLPTSWKEYYHSAVPGKIASNTFKLVESGGDSVALSAELENALEVTKRLSLDANSGQLKLTLTVRNTSSESLVPNVKTVPELYTQGEERPEIWANDGKAWRLLNPEPDTQKMEILPESGYAKLAAWFPAADVTLITDYTLGGARPFLYVYRSFAPYLQLNLDALVTQEPLAPGESRSATVLYYVQKEKPSAG